MRRKMEEIGVEIIDRVMMTDLLVQDGVVTGAVGFHTRSGVFHIFKAKATVVTTGTGSFKQGPMPIASFTADGEAMAYRVGAEITGKGFSFGECSAGVVADYPAWRGHGMATVRFTRYMNAEGDEITFRTGRYPDLRETTSFFEVHSGRGLIYWNLDAATPEDVKSILHHQKATGTNIESERIGLDFSKGGKIEMVGGAFTGSGAHGGTTGICPVNTWGAASLPGLFAAGNGCGSRQSGSSFPAPEAGLRDASVTGARAGLGAAEYARKAAEPEIDGAEIGRLRETIYQPLERKGGFSPCGCDGCLSHLVWGH